MSIVAPPTHDRNAALAPSPDALGQLSAALAERIALARSLPPEPSASECVAFVACDAQVQTQIDAWMLALSDASAVA